MAANDTLGLNQVFQIYNEDGSKYEGLVMHKSATDSVVMSLGDSITGDVYWINNELELTMHEYITYNGVNYVLVNPPTIVREGMVSDNSELKGMTKYSFKFYHPMYQLGNFPFSDVAVTNDQKRYLSENKTFSWIGTANDYLSKLNKNLEGTQWKVEMSSKFPDAKKTEMSEVLSFDKNTIAEALKVAYETWGVPYVVDVVKAGEQGYSSGKRFKVVWGLPSNEIYESAAKKQLNTPYIFKMGQGVGLKNNSRTPRNNKIITRIAGYGSENNIPYGYPQIVWTGNQSWDYTINNNPSATNSYPIYDGIVGGQKVRLIKHPFTRTHLMPNVYVESVNKKVNPNATGYNPNIELKDYYDATNGGDYPNPINAQSPSYDIHEFEDIKPELGNESITAVTPLNPDLTPASSWDDTMDDDGNYIQSYFQITLPTLSFDIYACASITESMEINMRSGACLGCTFPVEVDWEDYKANFYNENGVFDPIIHTQEGDGHVRNGKKYPDSSNSSTPVKLILKKENTTFGTLMPNTYQHPLAGDQFVVLGISLPTSYITDAQTRLDNAMKSYMLENNVYYYDYPLKFDEAFLRNNTYILEQLKPNAIVRFEFAGQQLQLFVKQMNVKFGDGVLPKYDITLTDNIDVVLNQIGQVADDVEKLSTLISILRQSYGSNAMVELAKKLSKVDDDTAQGFIRFVKGLQVGERFDSGLLGEGGVFRKDADGTTYIEADKLYIRMRAYFDTVEIRKFLHSGGNRVATVAGAKCVRVDNIALYNGNFVIVDENGTYWEEDINGDKHVVATGLTIVKYRCYFRAKDDDGNEITNDFVIGDQAYCHITNGATNALQMHHYWRLVVARSQAATMTEDGEHWIDLANYFDSSGNPANLSWTNSRGEVVTHKSHQAGSDIPVPQDDIVQLGNADDKTRQGAIIEYVSGEDAPSYKIYQEIDDFDLNDKNYISLGYSSQTGRAYMNVYGDAYIGDPDGSTFIKYEQEDSQTHQPKMTIKAVVEFQSPDDPSQTTTLDDFASAVVGDIENLQSQIDGEIDTWFYAGIPTLQNAPANEWTTDAEKEKHTGDLYYDIGTGADAGKAYRFVRSQTTPYVYSWQYIDDTAITEALRIAAHAQDTADHKRRVFVTQPVPPYDAGDLWSDATYPANNTEKDAGNNKYYKDLLTCKTAKAEGGSFSISDWGLTTNYTDDTALTNFVTNTYAPFVTNIQGQVDQKSETWYQDNDPSGSWNTTEKKESHVGDIWCDTSQNGGKKTYIWQDCGEGTSPRFYWAEQAVPDDVFDKIDGKADIFVSKPTTYNRNDLWIIESGIAAADIPIGCQTGDIVIADNMPSGINSRGSYNKSDWRKKDRYTDDTKIDNLLSNEYVTLLTQGTLSEAIENAQDAAESAQGTADAANAAAAALGYLSQALESDTQIVGGLVLSSLIGLRDANGTLWSGISGTYMEQETGTGYKGHGIASWYGGGQVDHEVSPSASGYAKSLFRFDGSGYLAGGNITWDDDGIVTIANVYADVNGTNTSLTGSLQTLTNLSNALPLSLQSGVTYLDPQYSFTNLKVLGNDVATQAWANGRFLTIEAFERLFNALNSSGTKVSHPYSSAVASIKAMFGLWTDQYLSAKGIGNSSGGSGVGDVTWDLLASNSDTRPIALSHISGALTSGGYATQAWVSNQGFLPLTGGNMTGDIRFDYDVDTSRVRGLWFRDTSKNGIATIFYHNTTQNIVLNPIGSTNAWVDAKGNYSLFVGNNKLTYNTYKIWHEGNDSGLFTALSSSNGTNLSITIGGTSKTISNLYALRLKAVQVLTDNQYGDLNDFDGTEYSVITNYFNNPRWLNAPTFNADCYGGAIVFRGVDNSLMGQLMWAAKHNEGTSPTQQLWWRARANKGWKNDWHTIAFTDSDITGNAATATTAGKITGAKINGTKFTGESDITTSSWGTSRDITISDADGTNSGTAVAVNGSAAKTLLLPSTIKASLTGNASSATALQTSRSIWGQDFNGTANVGGTLFVRDLSGSNVTNSAKIKFSNLIDGDSTYNSPYIQGIAVSPDNTYGRKRLGFFTTNATTYNTGWVEALSITPDGKVGIRNTTPSYNLDVSGSLRATGDITSNSGLVVVDSDAVHDMRMAWVTQSNVEYFNMYAYETNYWNLCIGYHTGSISNGALVLDAVAKKWGIGYASPKTKLDVNGGVKASKFYLVKPNADDDDGAIYLEYDSTNSGVHLVGAGFYSDSYVSAKGLNSSGGSGSGDFIPLSGSTNISGSLVPKTNTYNLGSSTYSWNHVYAGTLHANSVTTQSVLASSGFTVSGKDNTYVLLAGGGTKLLSEIGNVRSIKVGTTSYTPTNGVVTLPAYLPLAGGTMAGNVTFDTGSTEERAINFDTNRNGGNSGWAYSGIRFRDKNDTIFYQIGVLGNKSELTYGYIGTGNYDSVNNLRIYPTYPAWGSNMIWHAGNDGSDSGLDADLLDGLHANDFFKKSFIEHKAEGVNWYRVARLNTYSYSYLFSIGEAYNTTNPTSSTFIITTGYTNATIVQVNKAVKEPTGVDKVRVVRYTNGGYYVDVHCANTNTNGNTVRINVSNLSHENTQTGVTLYDWTVVSSLATGEVEVATANVSQTINSDKLSTSRKIWGQPFDGSSNISGSLTDCTSIDSLMHFDTTNGYVGIGTSSPNYHLDVLGQIRCKNNSTDNQQLSFGCYSDSNNPYIRMTDATGSYVDALSISNVGSTESPLYALKVGQSDRQIRILGSNVRMYTKTSADTNTYGLGLVVGYGGRVMLGSSTSIFSNNPDYRAVVDGSLYVSTNGKYDGTLDVTGATTLLSTLSVSGHITPSATATYNLGGSTLMYEYGYIRRLNTQSGYDLCLGAGGTQRIQISASDGTVSISSAVSMASTLTLASSLILANATYIRSKNKPSSGDATNINLLGLNASNEFLVGYGVGTAGYTTIIYGNSVSLRYSTSLSVGLYLNSSGNVSIGSTASTFITEKLNVNGNIKTATSDGAYIQIGGARIVWDNTNKALKVIQSDNSTAANFYATGAVSAKGANTASGGSTIDLTSVNSNILPSASSQYDIGSSSLKWRNGYFSGTISVAGYNVITTKSGQSISGNTTFGQIFVQASSKFDAGLGVAVDAPNAPWMLKTTYAHITTCLSIGASTSTSYKLYVNGDANVTGTLSVGTISYTNLSVSGTSTLTGNVGIGASANNSYKLYVSGGAKTTSDTTLCGGLKFTRDDGNAQYKITPAEEYEVRCYNTWYGTFRSSSDIRLKEIDKYYTSTTVEEISKAPVFDFLWKEDKKKRLELGTSAQYWKDVFPNAVSQMKDGYLAMDYGATALAASVITARKVVNHEARIRLLEVENEALRNEIEQLKKVA